MRQFLNRLIGQFTYSQRAKRVRHSGIATTFGSHSSPRSLVVEGLEHRALKTTLFATLAEPDVADGAEVIALNDDDEDVREEAKHLKPMFGAYFVWKIQCAADPDSAPCS